MGDVKWRLGTLATFRSLSSVFGLRRFVSSVRQAHIRFRVTVISQPAPWLDLYLDSRAEATSAPKQPAIAMAAPSKLHLHRELEAALASRGPGTGPHGHPYLATPQRVQLFPAVARDPSFHGWPVLMSYRSCKICIRKCDYVMTRLLRHLDIFPLLSCSPIYPLRS